MKNGLQPGCKRSQPEISGCSQVLYGSQWGMAIYIAQVMVRVSWITMRGFGSQPGCCKSVPGCTIMFSSSDPPACQILLVTEKEVKDKLQELRVAPYTDLVLSGGLPQQQKKQGSDSAPP